MMPTLYTSTSGMIEFQRGLDMISNNVTNIDTTGFKKSRISFGDLISQTVSAADSNQNAIQMGTGVGTAAIAAIYTQGVQRRTSNPTDMMVQGNGFFVLADARNPGQVVYSRAGNFHFDGGVDDAASGLPVVGPNGEVIYHLAEPTLTTPIRLVDLTTGYIVQGWLPDANGVITNTGTPVGIELTTPVATLAPKATTAITYQGNLDNEDPFKSTQYSPLGMKLLAGASLDGVTGYPADGAAGTYTLGIQADGSVRVTFVDNQTALALAPQAAPNLPVFTGVAGQPTQARAGTYTVVSNADGFAAVTYDDGVNPAVVIGNYAAGTLAVNRTDLQLIPGAALTVGATLDPNGSGSVTSILTLAPTTQIDYPAGTLAASTLNTTLIPGVTLDLGAALVGGDQVVLRSDGSFENIWGHPDSGAAGIYTIDSAADGSVRISFVEETQEAQLASSPVLDGLVGTPIDRTAGTYTLVSAADGSAALTFNDGYNAPTVTNFGAGTLAIDTDNTTIIPGLTLQAGGNLIGTTTITFVASDQVTHGAGYLTANTINRTLIPGVAITLGANLADHVVLATSGAATEGEEVVPGIIIDANGNQHRLELVLDHTAQNEWAYRARIATEENITAAGTITGETITLAYEPEPGSVEIFAGSSLVPVDDSRFAINGNQIVPIDTNGDNVTDSPVFAAGSTLTVRYKLAETTATSQSGTLEFDQYGAVTGAPVIINPTFGGGAFTLALDLSSLIQFSGSTNAEAATIDGYGPGSLVGINTDTTGKLVASYTNGQVQSLAQVALATFANPQGLTHQGDNYLTVSANSGAAVIAPPGAASAAGLIRGSSLEGSNVDLGEEISEMLIFQRAFQVNSRGVSTANEILKTAMDLKR